MINLGIIFVGMVAILTTVSAVGLAFFNGYEDLKPYWKCSDSERVVKPLDFSYLCMAMISSWVILYLCMA